MRESLEQKLKRLAKESEREMIDMGFQDKMNKVLYYTISNAKKRLGQCCEKRYINISKWLLEIGTDKEIKNVIIHEILHTFDDTIGHKEKWKMYARQVNNYGVYHITRTESIDKIYENNNAERPKDRYKIECLGCGAVWYKSRIQSNTMYGYRHGHRYHKQCGCNRFKVIDIKENEIIVNGNGDE